MPEASISTARAIALLDAAISSGVRHVVLAPGSRSQALAFAAAAAERQGAISLHVRIDERGAGFFALGIGRETSVPALAIVTSGTAVANLHPAVMEAHHARVPLIVVSADRPVELRGVRANQTTVQPQIFGSSVRLSANVEADDDLDATVMRDAVAAARGDRGAGAGPVHVNVAFRDPLASSLTDAQYFTPGDAPVRAPGVRPEAKLDRSRRTLVVAGADAGPAAEELAHVGGWPLIAEVSSGARFGRNLILNYRELLRDATFAAEVERVVVFGHPTLSREVPALVASDAVEAVVVDPDGDETFGAGWPTTTAVSTVSVADGAVDHAWLRRWREADRELIDAATVTVAPDAEAANSHDPATRLAHVKREFDHIRTPVDRSLLVDAVWRATWPHDRLVLGASRLIRVADQSVAGKRIPVHANRGLSGIDGTVATGLGIAAAADADGSPGVTRILVGDLTLLHDAGSLLRVDSERAPRVQVIVGDDRGGTIFDGLESASVGSEADRDRVLYTPHSVSFASLAEAYGWEFREAATRGTLDQALTEASTRPVLIHVPLDR